MTSELHTTLTAKQNTINPSNPMTGPVPFLSPANPDNNFNNANRNIFFTGDQANEQTVTASVIHNPDGQGGTSSVVPENISPGPEPSPPGEAFETNLSTRGQDTVAAGYPPPFGILNYDGTPNVQPEAEFANTCFKFGV